MAPPKTNIRAMILGTNADESSSIAYRHLVKYLAIDSGITMSVIVLSLPWCGNGIVAAVAAAEAANG